MVYRQLRAGATTLAQRPTLKPVSTLEETDILASGVTTGIQAHRVDMAFPDGAADALKVDFLLQQLSQRRVVQKGHRATFNWPTDHFAGNVAEAAHQAERIGPENPIHGQFRPDFVQVIDVVAEEPAITGHCHGIDGTGGGTDNDTERVAPVRIHIGDGPQHTDLIGRPRATTGHYHTGFAHDIAPIPYLQSVTPA